MSFELANCQNTLLREIADPIVKRLDVAKTYALALRSSECERVNWKKINYAIVERWSISALEWIKKQAWSGKCFEEKPK
jgi:hypothetical protein